MGTTATPILLWFRLDLRLADHPALQSALAAGGPILPVFVWAPEEEAPWQPGAASRWWLHHSLQQLDEALRARGSRLILRRGDSLAVLRDLVRETNARSVLWHRRYEPAVIARDTRIKEALKAEGVVVESYNGTLLHEPWTIQNQSGRPFQVFTPFWKNCLAQPDPDAPQPAPTKLPAPARWPRSETIESLELLPKLDWASGFKSAWKPGESGASEQLAAFTRASGPVLRYTEDRNFPGHTGTSRLSPHLHFGEVTPRQIWHAARQAAERAGLAAPEWRKWQFLAEVGWREFAYHLLFHFPHTSERPLRVDFEKFPWRTDAQALRAWQKGQTGYPFVDAGLRELWTTGWMHNRVRMVVGSFLVKNLLLSWQEGARWFWDTLVDADLASNTLGWQWVGGCGADAAPYFRVFNPVTQGQKFDPDGDYVRRWIPELARLGTPHLHAPWEAEPLTLREAGVTLGRTYPHPLVSLTGSRIAALEAFGSVRTGKAD